MRHKWGGWITITGAVGFMATVLSLHLMQPGYDPRHQFMSELALGPHGWAMLPAFCFFGLSVAGAQQGLGSFGGSKALRVLLALAAVALVGAGFIDLGLDATLHIALVTLAFVLIVLAMYLLPSKVGRLKWRHARGVSWTLAAGTALSVAGGQSPLPMGMAQRFAAACVLLWLVLLGWQLVRGSESI